MSTMHGWHVREFGGLDAMRWEELPVPEPGTGQLRVRVHASGSIFAISSSRYASSFGSGRTLSEYDAPSITL